MTKLASFTFGSWVWSRRANIGIGLREFALTSSLDPGNLSKYERERLLPPQDPEVLARMAQAPSVRLELRAADSGATPHP